MALEVFLSESAVKNIAQIEQYLAAKFGQEAKIDFLVLLTERLLLIAELPRIGTASQAKAGLYRFLIHKNTYVYYRFDRTQVEIVAVIDNRSDY